MDIAHSARKALIRIGKLFPFVLCAIVFVGYTESLFALIFENYMQYKDGFVLNTPISFAIATAIEYDLLFIIIAFVTSAAIEACIYNFLAIVYLLFNLAEKSFFATHEFDNNVYYIVSIINIALCTFFVYKGIKQLKK